MMSSTNFWMSTSWSSSSSSVDGDATEVMGSTASDTTPVSAEGPASNVDAADGAVDKASEDPFSDSTEELRASPLVAASAGGRGGERTEVGAGGGDWLFSFSGVDELFMDTAASDTSCRASLASL